MTRPSEGTEPLPLERRGSDMVLCMVLYRIPSLLGGTRGFAIACYALHCAVTSTTSLTCCVVASGPKVSTVHLTVPTRT